MNFAAHDDVIAAIASAPGGAGRGIIRLCGTQAIDCTRRFTTFDDHEIVAALGPVAGRGSLTLPEFATPVACDLFVWPDARSYARQTTVELHLPGSPPIVAAAREAACRAGARPARLGEVTLRAFLAGRIDLTQAEAVLGIVDAADRSQLNAALRQMAGGLAEPLQKLRNDLLDLTAHLEAGLDFVEEPIEFISRQQLLQQIGAARDATAALAAQTAARNDATSLPRIVLIGEPNAGKSSLFNALVGRAGALVSSSAGTTRDYLTARLKLDGVECELVDTAGRDDSETQGSSIAAEAQGFRHEQTREADVRVLCLDASCVRTDWEREQLEHVDPRRLVLFTKLDLAPRQNVVDGVSVATGQGLDVLRRRLLEQIIATSRASTDVVAATAVRCRDSLHRAATALDAAWNLVESRGGEELIAVELRSALDELGQIVGTVYTDDILDRIFSRFCIGK